ncbi:MAG: hypothetical protein GKR89_19950 [Candidatus Latescibacteria bacterium]|nr:hypothetical protein [Candidatus Latescibacterota bacterium]
MHALTRFDQAHHEQFMEQGYLRLGKVLSADELAALQQRIDDIMLGRVKYEHMRLQLIEENGQFRRTMGNEVATLAYRRIDDLEQDPLFLGYIQHSLFRQIAQRYIGDEVSVFRSMFMNKPPELKQELAWHQDVGIGWGIDANPIATVWTALDPATVATGCMQIVPGSHKHGIINERHFLPEEVEEQYAPAAKVEELETEAGEAILLHNFLLHRSGTNSTTGARRAFSVTYMDAATRTLDTVQAFPVVFGPGALDPATVEGKAVELVQKFYG